jgi:hypothetical protein
MKYGMKMDMEWMANWSFRDCQWIWNDHVWKIGVLGIANGMKGLKRTPMDNARFL